MTWRQLQSPCGLFTARLAKERQGWWLPLVPGVLSPSRPSATTPGAVERTKHSTQVQTTFAKLSLQTLHSSQCCTFAWCPVPAKATKSTAPGEVCPKAQAPNSFCTDKHRAFVSPVVCWLQGGISQEEQGRAAKIITLSGIQSVTNLSRGRRSRHHPAAVHLAV